MTTPEHSGATQTRVISCLTVSNTRSLSAQNRTHLLNNPKQLHTSEDGNQTGMDESASLYDIFMHQGSKDSFSVLALLKRILSGTSIPLLIIIRFGIKAVTHHYKRSQADKIPLSGIDPHASFSLGFTSGRRRQLQLPYDHLTVDRTAQLFHLKVHLKHFQQAAFEPAWETNSSACKTNTGCKALRRISATNMITLQWSKVLFTIISCFKKCRNR